MCGTAPLTVTSAVFSALRACQMPRPKRRSRTAAPTKETIAAIDVILDEGLSARAARLGEHLLGRLEELARRHPVVGHVRGRGLSAAVELVRDRRTREPAAGLGATVMKRALAEGLLLLPSGPHGSVIGLSPPLIIEASQLDLAVDVLDGTLAGL